MATQNCDIIMLLRNNNITSQYPPVSHCFILDNAGWFTATHGLLDYCASLELCLAVLDVSFDADKQYMDISVRHLFDAGLSFYVN